MPKRWKNELEIRAEEERSLLLLAEAKRIFLHDIRLLSPQTQRWYREYLAAVEKAFVRQEVDVYDIQNLTASLIKEHVVFYMYDEMSLKPNTINGRIRSVRALTKFLCAEGYIDKDFGADIPLIKSEKVIIEAFSEEQIEALLRQPDRRKFTGLRDYTIMLLLLETGIRIAECINTDLDNVRMKEGQILIHGKGAKQRLAPFQSNFQRALQRYLEVRRAAQILLPQSNMGQFNETKDPAIWRDFSLVPSVGHPAQDSALGVWPNDYQYDCVENRTMYHARAIDFQILQL